MIARLVAIGIAAAVALGCTVTVEDAELAASDRYVAQVQDLEARVEELKRAIREQRPRFNPGCCALELPAAAWMSDPSPSPPTRSASE
jgi:hypothetical protein